MTTKKRVTYSDLKIKVKKVDKRKKKLLICCFISFLIIISVIIVFFVCFPTNNSNNELIDKFNDNCLESHNYYRSLHGVQPLKYDSELAKVAKNRAQELISTDIFEHPKYDFKYGENLHYIMPFVRNYSCPKVVKPWYDEIKDYEFSDYRLSRGKIGHFTQVVWKTTERVGCAQAYSQQSKRLYTVCNYSPPGNWVNKYKENVLIPMIRRL